MRNYKAMGDAKLRACYEDLEGQPEHDRATIVNLAVQRGIASAEFEAKLTRQPVAVVAGRPQDGAGEYRPATEVFKVMLCDDGKPEDLLRFRPELWATEVKLDGWRILGHNVDGTNVRLVAGRNGSDYSGHVPHVERALRELPPDTCVDGEIIKTSGDFGHLQSAMSTGAVYTADDLQLVIFDVLRHEGQDVRKLYWSERRKIVEQLHVNGVQLNISPLMPTAPTTFEAVVAEGFEGIVCKKKSSLYVPGRRTGYDAPWKKFKAEATYEARVVGFKIGTGSFSKFLGALECEMLDTKVRFRVGGGFSVDLRKEIWANREYWKGKVIEFKCNGLMRSGKPRSPRFLRLRLDRS